MKEKSDNKTTFGNNTVNDVEMDPGLLSKQVNEEAIDESK